jgi:hypothetical protein
MPVRASAARHLALGLTLLPLLAGCADTYSPSSGSDNAEPQGADKCVGGRTKPFTAKAAAAIFKQHGFSVRISTTSTDCQGYDPKSFRPGELPAYSISNDPDWQGTPASEREGNLSCTVYKGPIWGSKLKKDLHAAPNSPIFSGRKAEFRYQNLECTLYPPEGDEGAHVRRIDQAFDAIVRRG